MVAVVADTVAPTIALPIAAPMAVVTPVAANPATMSAAGMLELYCVDKDGTAADISPCLHDRKSSLLGNAIKRPARCVGV